jgi:hypothetical protein
VLELQKEVLGEKHPDTITAMANLALTWRQQGRSNEAEQLQIEVLELRKEVLGEKHPDTIRAMANLAIVRRQLSCNNGEVGLENMLSNASNALDSVQREITFNKSQSRLKRWKRKFIKWRRNEDA